MFKYYTDNNYVVLLSFESPFDLFSLVLQISDEVKLMFGNPSYQYYIDPIKYADSEENISDYAKSKSIPYKNNPDINYADHGYLNLALTKVRFIHSFSKMVFELKDSSFNGLINSNHYAIRSMCKALDTFSEWKAMHRRMEIEIKGESWRSATGWVKWVPNEYSKQIKY